jgi:thymidylate synthase (FAD)
MLKAELVDYMGDDGSVANAARVSFSKDAANYKPSENAGLIKYLAKHNHWTPFAHTAITLRMSAPVPIRTQCFKHKAGFTENEESRRYISSRPEVFVPDAFRSAPEGSVKQGSGGVHRFHWLWWCVYRSVTWVCVALYMAMIRANVCPEQARFLLPQGCIVNWIWTGNVASYARFYNQRTDPHAQAEIRDLAEMVGDVVGGLYPVAWEALT